MYLSNILYAAVAEIVLLYSCIHTSYILHSVKYTYYCMTAGNFTCVNMYTTLQHSRRPIYRSHSDTAKIVSPSSVILPTITIFTRDYKDDSPIHMQAVLVRIENWNQQTKALSAFRIHTARYYTYSLLTLCVCAPLCVSLSRTLPLSRRMCVSYQHIISTCFVLFSMYVGAGFFSLHTSAIRFKRVK